VSGGPLVGRDLVAGQSAVCVVGGWVGYSEAAFGFQRPEPARHAISRPLPLLDVRLKDAETPLSR
jgi:hypothetical protein